MDHVLTDPLAPVTLLDLTDARHQEILIDILNHHPPDYIHLGMPCGTASRAREKPISHHQRQMGAPNPPPLRSATHPLGLPHINPATTSGIRLAKANQLYRFVIQLLYLAMRHGSVISLENPHRSWFWAAILAIILEINDPQLTNFWDSLHDVFSTIAVMVDSAKRALDGNPHQEFLMHCPQYAKMTMSTFPSKSPDWMDSGHSILPPKLLTLVSSPNGSPTW